MKGTRHSEEQMITILKQGEAGLTTAELCRQHGIDTNKRATVQERHWAHFVSAIRLSKSSPFPTMTANLLRACQPK